MSSSKSNWVTKQLKGLDFLGEGLNFTIENRPHLKTVSGGVLRVFLYLLGIFFFIYFGRDFISRTNPQVYYEVKESLKPLNFTYTANDFFFAIRFANKDQEYVDLSDYFHLIATYDQMTATSDTEYNHQRKNIPMVRCTDNNFDSKTENFLAIAHLINFSFFFSFYTTNTISLIYPYYSTRI